MCVTKLLLTSECRKGDAPLRSLVSGNTERSLYRVLRGSSRGELRSVNRECAGRNAASVNGIEPRQTCNFCGGRASMRKRRQHRSITGSLRGVWRKRLRIARDPVIESAPPGSKTAACTQRPAAERERSARGRANAARPRLRVEGQGVKSKSTRQFLKQKSDAFIVVTKWGNAHGAKGGTACDSAPRSDLYGVHRSAYQRRHADSPNSLGGAGTRSVAQLTWSMNCSDDLNPDSITNHKPKSRMREIRTSGSVRSARQQCLAFT